MKLVQTAQVFQNGLQRFGDRWNLGETMDCDIEYGKKAKADVPEVRGK